MNTFATIAKSRKIAARIAILAVLSLIGAYFIQVCNINCHYFALNQKEQELRRLETDNLQKEENLLARTEEINIDQVAQGHNFSRVENIEYVEYPASRVAER